MSLLDKFERSMERMLEGTVGSVFRQSLQPAQLGKLLRRAMLDQKRASVGTSIVPNRYVVHLHPSDFEGFVTFKDGLSRQMALFLTEEASARNFSVLDRIVVELVEDEKVRKRSPRIEATITDIAPRRPAPMTRPASQEAAKSGASWWKGSSRQEPAQATQQFRPQRPAAVSSRDQLMLRVVSGVASGQELRLGEGITTIGRASENTLVINAPDVSRHHARVEWAGDQARIHDLGSTNGTRVNGEAIRISDLMPGDTITLGSHELRVIPIPGDR